MPKRGDYVVWARVIEPLTAWHPLRIDLTEKEAREDVITGNARSHKFATYIRYWTGPEGSLPPAETPEKVSNAST